MRYIDILAIKMALGCLVAAGALWFWVDGWHQLERWLLDRYLVRRKREEAAEDLARYPEVFAPLTLGRLRQLYDTPARISLEVAALVERMEIIEDEVRKDPSKKNEEIGAAAFDRFPVHPWWRPDLEPGRLVDNVSLARRTMPEWVLGDIDIPFFAPFLARPMSVVLRENGALLVEEAHRDPLRAAAYYPTFLQVAEKVGYRVYWGLFDALTDDHDGYDDVREENLAHMKRLEQWRAAGSPDAAAIIDLWRQAKPGRHAEPDPVEEDDSIYL